MIVLRAVTLSYKVLHSLAAQLNLLDYNL